MRSKSGRCKRVGITTLLGLALLTGPAWAQDKDGTVEPDGAPSMGEMIQNLPAMTGQDGSTTTTKDCGLPRAVSVHRKRQHDTSWGDRDWVALRFNHSATLDYDVTEQQQIGRISARHRTVGVLAGNEHEVLSASFEAGYQFGEGLRGEAYARVSGMLAGRWEYTPLNKRFDASQPLAMSTELEIWSDSYTHQFVVYGVPVIVSVSMDVNMTASIEARLVLNQCEQGVRGGGGVTLTVTAGAKGGIGGKADLKEVLDFLPDFITDLIGMIDIISGEAHAGLGIKLQGSAGLQVPFVLTTREQSIQITLTWAARMDLYAYLVIKVKVGVEFDVPGWVPFVGGEEVDLTRSLTLVDERVSIPGFPMSWDGEVPLASFSL